MMEQSTQETFATRLKVLLRQSGLNQSTLAKKSGVDRTRINRLANGKSEPRTDEIEWLAAALGVDSATLVDGIDFVGEPPGREEEMAKVATRILEVMRERDEALLRVAALEKSLVAIQKQFASQLDTVYATLHQEKEEHANEVTALTQAHEQEKEQLRVASQKHEQQWERRLGQIQETASRREANLQMTVANNELVHADLMSQLQYQKNRSVQLESAVAAASGTALVSVLGRLVTSVSTLTAL